MSGSHIVDTTTRTSQFLAPQNTQNTQNTQHKQTNPIQSNPIQRSQLLNPTPVATSAHHAHNSSRRTEVPTSRQIKTRRETDIIYKWIRYPVQGERDVPCESYYDVYRRSWFPLSLRTVVVVVGEVWWWLTGRCGPVVRFWLGLEAVTGVTVGVGVACPRKLHVDWKRTGKGSHGNWQL